MTRVLLFLVLLLGVAQPIAAQTGPLFRFTFGWQDMSGDMGPVMDGAVDADFSIMVPFKAVRFGAGANWVSFAMDDLDESWSQVRFHALLAYPYQVNEWFRPYIEGHLTYRRLRPEGDRYYGGEEELLGDFVASGTGFEGMIGTEFILYDRAAIDLSFAAGGFGISPDLSGEGLGDIDSGMAWRINAGIAWFPTNGR